MALWKSFGNFLFIQIQMTYIALATPTFMASFQTDIKSNNLATTDVWIEFPAHIPETKEFTVCHWIKIKFYNNDIAGSLWAYCTVENPNQQIKCLQVYMESASDNLGRTLLFAIQMPLRNYENIINRKIELKNYRHRTWTHLCWSFSARTGESRYYHDGVVFGVERFNVSNDDVAIWDSREMSDSALLFGQEPDTIRGGFEKDEAYLGHMSEFNIWNRTLSDKDILNMALCKTNMKGNIVAWEKSGLLRHSVAIEDVKYISHFCENSQTKYVIFPEKMRFSEAKNLCKVHGGDLSLPKSDQESKKILDIVSKHKAKCTRNSDSTNENAVWLGARKIGHRWYSLNSDKILNYTKITYPKSNPDSDCANLNNDGTWLQDKSGCNYLSLCTVCEIKETTVFTIKGLCNESDYEWNYYPIIDGDDQIKLYEGYRRSQIIFNSSTQEWSFAPHPDYAKTTFAMMEPMKDHHLNHPIGRKIWTINDPYCENDFPQNTLTLSACRFPHQFTCNSGHCIDMAHRCDLKTKQCLDGSDEEFCDWVFIPPSYNVASAPVSPDEGNPLDIPIMVDIESIESIDTVNMIFELTMKLTLEWYDKVLTFSNLIPDTNNMIPNDNISALWTPVQGMIQWNAIIGEVKTDGHSRMSVFATKATKPDGSSPIENRLFDGASNPLRLFVRMKTKYRCTFDVSRFPFDKHECPLIMNIYQHRHYKLRFINKRLNTYSGEKIIDQFSIGEFRSETTYSNTSTKFIVYVNMSRLPINQFLNTFLPTVVLWLFIYATLFIHPNENGFNNRFMGSGTALLIIATLIKIVKVICQKPHTRNSLIFGFCGM